MSRFANFIISLTGLSIFWGAHELMKSVVFTEPISEGLIAEYLLNGNADDETGLYDGLVDGAEITFDRFSQTNAAMRFDGIGDKINLGPDFTLSEKNITISLWVYPFTGTIPGDTMALDPINDQYFISSGGIGRSTGIYGIWNKGALLTGHNLTDRQTPYRYHGYLKDSTWHHIVMSFDTITGESWTYVNGDLLTHHSYISGSNLTGTDDLYIGSANFADSIGFFGKIDNVRIYNYILSTAEIASLYNEECSNTIYISNLEVHKDTLIYARDNIFIDTLHIDTAVDLTLIAPEVSLSNDGYTLPISRMIIKGINGCNQNQSAIDLHFQHRGIYINNFVTGGYLGDIAREDSLLNWCIKEDFNAIYLYNIGTALASGMAEDLDDFVFKAQSTPYHINVTFVSAGFGTSFDNIISYHENYNNHPNGIVSEIEFWNGSGNYEADYVPWLDRMDSLKYKILPPESSSLNPNLLRQFYIGKIKNPGETPSIAIAEDLVTHHEQIFLTNYHSNAYNLSTSPSENSIRNKLSLLGEAGYNLGKKVNVVVLFNVRQDSPAPQIWNYFDSNSNDHDFKSAYEKFYHDFTLASDITYKNYLELKGYGIYRFTDANEAR